MQKTIENTHENSLESDNAEWIERQTRSPEARRLYEIERLITSVQEELAGAIAESGLKRSQIAEQMGTSKANITQALRGSRNLTLHTIASIACASGFRISLSREPLRQGVFISCPVRLVRSFRPRYVLDPAQESGATRDDATMGMFGVGG